MSSSAPAPPTVDPAEATRGAAAYPSARVAAGELHLVRRRLELLLVRVQGLVDGDGADEQAWRRIEEAVRVARRAVVAGMTALPPQAPLATGEFRVGDLVVSAGARRQWYGNREVILTSTQHHLLVVVAREPYRVFAKDELLHLVWDKREIRFDAVTVAVARVRRALVAAGAPAGEVLRSYRGVGWALVAQP